MYPYRPIHPGELIKDEVNYREIDHKQLAKIAGVDFEILEDTFNEKRPVTAEFALRVCTALDLGDAYSFVRMQAKYDMQVAEWDKKLAKKLAVILNKAKNAGYYGELKFENQPDFQYPMPAHQPNFRYPVVNNVQNFEPLRVAA
jgi:addiction module HigA family antidote